MSPHSAGSGKYRKDSDKPRISEQTIAGFAEVFKLLADRSRLKIMLTLAHGGEMHVSQLCKLLRATQPRTSQPAVSHHLTLLRMAGLVGNRRDGKRNYYRLVSAPIRDLLEQFFAGSSEGLKQLQFEDFSLAYKRK